VSILQIEIKLLDGRLLKIRIGYGGGSEETASPVNGGPGSMLATKFGNEEVSGRFGKGFLQASGGVSAPLSPASNTNGGLEGQE